DSLSIIPHQFGLQNYVYNKFEKQINTYDLQNQLKYGTRVGKFNFGVFNHFTSTLVKSRIKNIKDNNKFSLFAEYSYSPKLSFGVLLNSVYFDDDRNTSINKTSKTESIVFTKYRPINRLSIVPFAGYSFNQLIGIEDNGFTYGSEFLVNHLLLDDFDVYGNLKFQNEDILPRRNFMRLANVTVKNESENIHNTVQIYYNQNGKDFYVQNDEMSYPNYYFDKNIQNRDERQYFVNEQLRYIPFSSNFSFDFSANLSYRDISKTNKYYLDYSNSDNNFDTEFNEFGLSFNAATRYISESLSSMLKISYTEKEEKYNVISGKQYLYDILEQRKEIERKKNNQSRIITLTLLGTYKLSSSDLISFSSFFRKLKYDTPSEQNYDDRDEVLAIIRLMYLRKLNPFLNLFVNLEGNFNHLVYIFARKSANNNKRRILKLATGADYKGKFVSSKNSFEVSANYTTYDFEDLVPNYSSFSFRQFVAKDSSRVKLTARTGVSFIGKLKLSEQGDFSWTDFSSKPVRYIKEIYLEPKYYYQFSRIRFAAGLKYFLLNTYNYRENEKILNTSYQSIGPLAEILIKTDEKLYFRFTGWYEFIKRENSGKSELLNMNLELNWIL
ncbi:MAG: hypothetical protein ACEPO8_14455, partial [Rhodothermaceae bacterium]